MLPSYLGVISIATERLTNWINLGVNEFPWSIAVDPVTHEVYVAAGAGDVVVVAESNFSVVARIHVGGYPYSIAFDPVNGNLYATSFSTGNISIISSSFNRVLGVFGVLPFPEVDAFNSVTGQLIVAGAYGFTPVGYVASVNLSSQQAVWQWEPAWNSTGGNLGPFQVACDPVTGYVYATWAPGGPPLPSVAVFNGSSGALLKSIPVGPRSANSAYGVFGLAVDAAGHRVFVTNPNLNRITILNTSNLSVASTQATAAYPFGLAFDPSLDSVFVTATNSQSLTVVNASVPADIQTISLGAAPVALAVDATNGWIFAVGADHLYRASIQNHTLLGETSTGLQPDGIAYDPENAKVFVALASADIVQVFSATTLGLLANISVDAGPAGLTYDNATHMVYVTCSGSNTLDAISASNDAVAGRVRVGVQPIAVVTTTAPNAAFVANYASSAISIVSLTNLTVVATLGLPTFSFPDGLAVNPVSGLLYVSEQGTGNVSILSIATHQTTGTLPVGGNPAGIALSPTGLQLFVANYGSTTMVVGQTTPLNVTGSVGVGWMPTAVVVSAATDEIFVSNSGSGNVSVAGPGPESYSVTFPEAGLPAGTRWTVEFANQSASASAPNPVLFLVPNGTYAYAIADIPGWHQTTASYSGPITVNGTPVQFPTLRFSEMIWRVLFTESGLATGTSWAVTLGNASASGSAATLGFEVANATYVFRVSCANYTATPANGSLAVTGTTLPQVVRFAPRPGVTLVSFNETGLGPGVPWGLILQGASGLNRTVRWNGAAITVYLPNSTYQYRVFGSGNWTPIDGGYGSLTITGSEVDLGVTFEYSFPVTFSQVGIPTGTSWTLIVTAVGLTPPPSALPSAQSSVGRWEVNATGASLTIRLPNGTYNYSIRSPGYQAAAGTVSVSGGPVHTTSSMSPEPIPAGLPWGWMVAVSLIVAAAVAATTILWIHRRGHRRPPG